MFLRMLVLHGPSRFELACTKLPDTLDRGLKTVLIILGAAN